MNDSSNRRIANVATSVTIIVALCAGVLSWQGLTQLGRVSGLGPLSVLLPIVIDGGMLVGALHVLQASLTGRSTTWGWLMTWVGIVVSVWGNIMGTEILNFTSAIVHAIPALMLAATIEASMQIIKQRLRLERNDHRTEERDDTVRVVHEGSALPSAVDEASVDDLTKPSRDTSDVDVPAWGTQIEAPAEVAVSTQSAINASRDITDHKVIAMGVWMAEEKSAGRTPTARRAVDSGLANSDSTARRLQKKVEHIGLDHFQEQAHMIKEHSLERMLQA